MIVGCASNCVEKYEYIKLDLIEKAFLMKRYETLMTLIGWRMIANWLLWKHIVPQQYSFNHHTKWEPEKLCSSIYSLGIVLICEGTVSLLCFNNRWVLINFAKWYRQNIMWIWAHYILRIPKYTVVIIIISITSRTVECIIMAFQQWCSDC